ncbi:hypothetical protein E0K89_003430 [Aquicoccus sp. SCR17]|nr:hypothetical protein [Carideicomes alvinocaridis]
MSIFSIFMVLIILAMGGIGIDMMNSEIHRLKLQNTLDRAILAAADLDQAQPARNVVNDYFAKAGLTDALADVQVDEGLNYRTVSAEAELGFRPLFMHLLGVGDMEASASGTATERVNNVEISLVLDISGSMDGNSKLINMQAAAENFIDAVINDRSADLVSVNLIPYSEHVNAGEWIARDVNLHERHPYSWCVEFSDAEFGTSYIDTTIRHEQAQHFQWNYDGRHNDRSNTVCPRYSYEEIRPFSQDATALKDQIGDLRPRAGTSIFLGMKWATGMLDPHFRPITQDLVSRGLVDAGFADRPAAFSDEETLKVIVLMTDGMNDRSNRITESIYDGNEGHWDRYNLWYYLYRQNVSSWYRPYYYYQKYDAAQGDRLLENVCNAAKDAGIVVWSIGFEVTDHGAAVMEGCASSPNHFFRVEGTEIGDAFSTVAQQINQLKLIQ